MDNLLYSHPSCCAQLRACIAFLACSSQHLDPLPAPVLGYCICTSVGCQLLREHKSSLLGGSNHIIRLWWLLGTRHLFMVPNT
jgi:hypothetical protein